MDIKCLGGRVAGGQLGVMGGAGGMEGRGGGWGWVGCVFGRGGGWGIVGGM